MKRMNIILQMAIIVPVALTCAPNQHAYSETYQPTRVLSTQTIESPLSNTLLDNTFAGKQLPFTLNQHFGQQKTSHSLTETADLPWWFCHLNPQYCGGFPY